jgi:asparagine synthase (glutamine-hydrolysing)
MFTVPVGEWFRKESHGWLRNCFAGSGLVQELFAPAEVERMLARHRDGSANFTRELRALAAIALWDGQR